MGGWLGQITLGLFDMIHSWQTCMVGEPALGELG